MQCTFTTVLRLPLLSGLSPCGRAVEAVEHAASFQASAPAYPLPPLKPAVLSRGRLSQQPQQRRANMADIPPSPTIYINNLYEKLTKDELKKGLYAMFSQFGKIVDVVALKTLKLRGQAWVVFTDSAAATNALRTMNGFPFFEKPIRISYAKTESDAIAKLKGTYKPDLKKKKAVEKPVGKEAGKKTKSIMAPRQGAQGPAEQAPPNKTLFVQGLPEATTDQMLQMLFAQFPGFKEIRMIEARPGIAFVDFDNEMQSGVALQGLQGFKITPQHAMAITFAKQ